MCYDFAEPKSASARISELPGNRSLYKPRQHGDKSVLNSDMYFCEQEHSYTGDKRLSRLNLHNHGECQQDQSVPSSSGLWVGQHS